jgi:hypothetical protein
MKKNNVTQDHIYQFLRIQNVLQRASKRYTAAAVKRRIGADNTREIKKAMRGDVKSLTIDSLTRWAAALGLVVNLSLETPRHARSRRRLRVLKYVLVALLWPLAVRLWELWGASWN